MKMVLLLFTTDAYAVAQAQGVTIIGYTVINEIGYAGFACPLTCTHFSSTHLLFAALHVLPGNYVFASPYAR